VTCDDDVNIQALLAAKTPVITIFGKASAFHAENVLGISKDENLELVSDSVDYLAARCDQVFFDAEHFFDGFAEDRDYALAVVKAAAQAGAKRLVLCDTNGGSLIDLVQRGCDACAAATDVPFGMHAHDDSGLAVANSLQAVESGAKMIQGTINGYGERCGNANLVTLIPNLQLKMGRQCIPEASLQSLTKMSRTVDEITNHMPSPRQPFVGRRAFAHKGGVHVNAVMKDSRSYEHMLPAAVGNTRRVLVSDLAGRSNIVIKAREFGIDLDQQHPWTRAFLDRIKDLEYDGYQFEGAEASLRLLMEEARGQRPFFFNVRSATVTTSVFESEDEGEGDKRSQDNRSHAEVAINVGDKREQAQAEGNGPVHALGSAFRQILQEFYPEVKRLRLTDYKVRILSSGMGIASTVRVLIRASDGKQSWGTVGVSTNVVEASWQALVDSFEHMLIQEGAQRLGQRGSDVGIDADAAAVSVGAG